MFNDEFNLYIIYDGDIAEVEHPFTFEQVL